MAKQAQEGCQTEALNQADVEDWLQSESLTQCSACRACLVELWEITSVQFFHL